jgi:hypothetical protein
VYTFIQPTKSSSTPFDSKADAVGPTEDITFDVFAKWHGGGSLMVKGPCGGWLVWL